MPNFAWSATCLLMTWYYNIYMYSGDRFGFCIWIGTHKHDKWKLEYLHIILCDVIWVNIDDNYKQ